MVAVQTRNRQMPKISRVKLLKKIKISTSAGATWTLVPALFDSKGRVRRDHVTVAGQDEVHAEGSYYLEWWEGGKRYREAAGPNGFAAADKVRAKQAELDAVRNGIIPVPPVVEVAQERTTLKHASMRIRITSATTAHCEPSAPTVPSSTPSGVLHQDLHR
jgi:integrase/recombinase XerD